MLTPEENYREFAVDRSHADAQISNENLRATGQAMILINGGAATAVLAFLSKESVNSPLLHVAAECLIVYGAGVFFGAAMMYSKNRSLDHYNIYWRLEAFPRSGWRRKPKPGRGWMRDENPDVDKIRNKARRWWRTANWFFGFSTAAFLGASFLIAWTLYGFKAAAINCF
jgi:hypothetical protein